MSGQANSDFTCCSDYPSLHMYWKVGILKMAAFPFYCHSKIEQLRVKKCLCTKSLPTYSVFNGSSSFCKKKNKKNSSLKP